MLLRARFCQGSFPISPKVGVNQYKSNTLSKKRCLQKKKKFIMKLLKEAQAYSTQGESQGVVRADRKRITSPQAKQSTHHHRNAIILGQDKDKKDLVLPGWHFTIPARQRSLRQEPRAECRELCIPSAALPSPPHRLLDQAWSVSGLFHSSSTLPVEVTPGGQDLSYSC